jgi:hypothetical protein
VGDANEGSAQVVPVEDDPLAHEPSARTSCGVAGQLGRPVFFMRDPSWPLWTGLKEPTPRV